MKLISLISALMPLDTKLVASRPQNRARVPPHCSSPKPKTIGHVLLRPGIFELYLYTTSNLSQKKNPKNLN